MLNLRKLSFLKIVQDTGQMLKNGFYGADYRRAVFRQAVWKEHKAVSLPSCSQVLAVPNRDCTLLLPISMGPRAEEVQVSLL